ncbi:MAG: UDP-N-acetylmuramoyl-L-alanine--D-glutamate ligase [Oscillospiraceae bacterium]|nr:UDP-N-acetylmuramoyl-L-alanine--D-glutamate ligase [Oscillospiraceae bacterium]
MTLQEYINSLRGKTVAVAGVGVSNLPLLRLLAAAGIDVTACDQHEKEHFGADYAALSAQGVKWSLGSGYLDDLHYDVVFRTPGLHPNKLKAGLGVHTVVTSEMEAFFQVCPCDIVAVTGSDGKTTTTTVISEILKAAGRRVWVGGNIGTPLLDKAPGMDSGDICVLELSSFQLMTMSQAPRIAVVTNLAPNHLDIHTDMGEYVAAKRNIFACSPPPEAVVLNADNAITRSFLPDIAAGARLFSRREAVENGAYLKDGSLVLAKDGAITPVLPAPEILIPGDHNVENYLAAFAALRDLASPKTMAQVARSFPGVEHRIQLVRTLRGVRYYNDSIASSPSRTTAGLRSFKEKVILIAGGHDKRIPFDGLAAEILEHVKALYLVGETAEKLRDAVLSCPGYDPDALPVTVCEDFRETVLAASKAAREGDVVILSPACSSFDRFRNFAERGDTFREIVEELE